MLGRRNKREPDPLAQYPANYPHPGQGHGQQSLPEPPARRRGPRASTEYRPAGEGSGTKSKRNRRLPGEQTAPSYTPSIAARSIDGHLLRNGHRRLRLVPALAAALVVPVRLAAPGPDRRDRGPVRRTARPVDAPARHDPAVPDPDVGRGARAQRREPAARRAGRAVLRRLPGRRAAAADGPVDGREGGLPRRPGADPQRRGPGRRAGRPAAAQDLPRGRRRRTGRASTARSSTWTRSSARPGWRAGRSRRTRSPG